MKAQAVIILGCARSVWEDAEAALQLFPLAPVAAINDAGAYWPAFLSYWFSRHPDVLEPLMALRKARGGNMDFEVNTDFSGLPGGTVAEAIVSLALRFRRVVLAGVPLDDGPHFYSPTPWSHSGPGMRGCLTSLAESHQLRGKVFSMSGWTRAVFGAPSVWED